MKITETGYYETRDGGLAYVVGFIPHHMSHSPYLVMGVTDGQFKRWSLAGEFTVGIEALVDLIRYIGKELPTFWKCTASNSEGSGFVFTNEEKPQPERVEKVSKNVEYPIAFPELSSESDPDIWGNPEEYEKTRDSMGHSLKKPERVELSKLWVCWSKWADNWFPSECRWSSLEKAQEHAKEYNISHPDKILAITLADATSFTIGENLND